MSIVPLITFKAGICDFDVSRDLSLSILGMSSTLPTSHTQLFSNGKCRPAHRLPKSSPNLVPATSTSMKKMSLFTSAGGLAPHQ